MEWRRELAKVLRWQGVSSIHLITGDSDNFGILVYDKDDKLWILIIYDEQGEKTREFHRDFDLACTSASEYGLTNIKKIA